MVVGVYMSEVGRDLLLADKAATVIVDQAVESWRFLFELDINDPLLEGAISEATEAAITSKGFLVIPREA